jgi:putative FmdB family regulatory protein
VRFRKLNGCTNPSKVPTYEFTCPQGHDFEKFYRSMASAPTVVPCPVCGEPADRQVSAGAGLVFHGSGFYITDYGKDGKKDQKPAGRKTSESAKDSGESKAGEPSAGESKSADAKSDSGSSGSSSSGASESKPAESSAKASDSAPKTTPPPKAAE